MPYDDPDPTDPTMLVGTEVPAAADSDLEMAYAFAEEFAALGFSESRLLSLFRQPFYAGAHRALLRLGEERIQSIIQETVQVWGKFRFVIHDAAHMPQGFDVSVQSLTAAEPERQDTSLVRTANLSQVGHERTVGTASVYERRSTSRACSAAPSQSRFYDELVLGEPQGQSQSIAHRSQQGNEVDHEPSL